MTLSRFLRDYLYIPLGGSRNGPVHRYSNLMITMLLGGLWHGAGWTFVIWGGLHGLYLIVNHAWRYGKRRMGWGAGGRLANLGAGALTFLAVVIGWVFFRADSVSSAMTMLRGMAGMNGVALPTLFEGMLAQYAARYDWIVFSIPLPLTHLNTVKALVFLSLGFAIAWLLPNVRELFRAWRPTCEDLKEDKQAADAGSLSKRPGLFLRHLQWQPTKPQAICYGILFFTIMSYMASAGKSEFLYFQF